MRRHVLSGLVLVAVGSVTALSVAPAATAATATGQVTLVHE